MNIHVSNRSRLHGSLPESADMAKPEFGRGFGSGFVGPVGIAHQSCRFGGLVGVVCFELLVVWLVCDWCAIPSPTVHHCTHSQFFEQISY